MGPYIQRKLTRVDELVEIITADSIAGSTYWVTRVRHTGRWQDGDRYIQCDNCDWRSHGPRGRDYDRTRFRHNTHSMQLVRHRAEVAIAEGLWP